MSAKESLMPGPEGKTPRFYEVDRGQKTESYINAISGNPVPPPAGAVHYSKVNDEITTDDPLIPDKSTPSNGIGLTEQQLIQYRDSRFWKLLRIFLFVVFWIIWLLLFLLAIAIVVLSPGCVTIARPNWWQTSVTYSIWVPSFQDSDGDGVGDMAGLISRLENLRKSGVQTVWPSPFISSDNLGSAVKNFAQVDSSIGSQLDAERFINETHDADMKVVISIPISTTSIDHEWFQKSASASKPENRNYSQFYHWSEKEDDVYHKKLKSLAYLHEKNEPRAAILNWKDPSVRDHMFTVLSSWIDRGVDGFYLQGIEYLARTPSGVAPDWPAIIDILRDIRHHVDTYAEESVVLPKNTKIALFVTRDEAKEKDKVVLATSGVDSIINYELGNVMKDTEICHRSEGSVAICVHEILSDVLLFHSNNEEVWPHWEFGNAFISRLATRAGSRAHAELLTLLQLTLPGTNNIYYGEEIGMRDLANDTKVPPQRGAMLWDDTLNAGFTDRQDSQIPVHPDYKNINWKRQYEEERSQLKMFTKLAKLRKRDDTFQMGKTYVGGFVDGAFTLTRFLQHANATTGHIYLAALNFATNDVTLPLIDQPNAANLGTAQVVTATSRAPFRAREPIDLSSKSLTLPSNTGVVIRYSA